MLLFIAVDGYCVVYCEKKQVTTRVVRDTVNPEWNERVTFYLKKPDEDIVIEVNTYIKYSHLLTSIIMFFFFFLAPVK